MASDSEAVFLYPDGDYQAEVAQEIGSDDSGEPVFQLFRFSLEQLQKVPKGDKLYLVSKNWDPSWPHPLERYEEWFMDDLEKVARSAGYSVEDLANWLCSDDYRDRLRAYSDIGGYHGFMNFDTETQEISEEALNDRWT